MKTDALFEREATERATWVCAMRVTLALDVERTAVRLPDSVSAASSLRPMSTSLTAVRTGLR